ncbi:MAG TPA: tetraacyldisaccharide 4'-kinase [Terracidiphilus sp.]|nr:tetraacyldisaccharide 4'-kinase [Terracidiphilus sp.]
MKPPSSARRLLLPLVPLYRIALALRELQLGSKLEPVRRLRFPVVSIGSLSAGGSGKTPLTIALAQALTRRGLNVDVLSRGYGRRSQAALCVNPNGAAEEFGDEPLLIASESGVPVYVAAQRYEAGLLAEAAAEQPSSEIEASQTRTGEGASSLEGTGFSPYISASKSPGALAPEEIFSGSLHLLDDGFQHRQLRRDVDILLLDSQDFQDHLLPAGNLREPLKAIHRATVLAIPAGDPELEAKLKASGWQGPIWRLHRRMEVPQIAGPVAAFCGIARSEQFFEGLVAAGLHLASRIAFADHHHYKAHDLDCIQDAARSIGATAIVTTEKDRVRLGKLGKSLSLKTARLRIEIENESAAVSWLEDRLAISPLRNS